MRIENEFTVGVPVERAWEVLTDLEAIAPCMPGAQLTGVEGDTYSGKLKLKVGPVVSDFAGTASFVTKDDAAHRAVIDAKGRDARGSGNASASITASLRPDGDRTVVSVDTDLRISGKLAQFGNRMIGQVSEKLLKQFVSCLETQLLADPGPASTGPSASATAGSSASAGTAPGPSASVASAEGAEPLATEAKAARGLSAVPSEVGAGTGETATGGEASAAAGEETAAAGVVEGDRRHGLRAVQPEAEPVDLVKLAGGTVAKRVVPAIVVLIVVIVVIWLLVR